MIGKRTSLLAAMMVAVAGSLGAKSVVEELREEPTIPPRKRERYIIDENVTLRTTAPSMNESVKASLKAAQEKRDARAAKRLAILKNNRCVHCGKLFLVGEVRECKWRHDVTISDDSTTASGICVVDHARQT